MTLGVICYNNLILFLILVVNIFVSVPNFITIARLFLIPIFIILMIQEEYGFALLVFIFSGITDMVDGYIARKYNMVTKWGKFLDPLVDKLFQFTALVMIGVKIQNLAPLVIPIIFIIAGKEILMGIGSLMLYKSGVVVSANWYGKLATFIFYVAVGFSLLIPSYGQALLIIAVISAIFAFLMYLLNYLKIRRTMKGKIYDKPKS